MKNEITKHEEKICDKVLEWLNKIKGKKILDLGGGIGNTDKYYKKNSGKEIICVDIQKGDITHNLNKGIPFEDESVDGIIASNIIQHLDRPLDFLKECKRVLKKEGLIILITPNALSLQQIMIHYGMKYPLEVNYTYQIYLWNRYNFNFLVKHSRLEIVECKLYEWFWGRNILFKFLAWIFPFFRPKLFYVLKKPSNEGSKRENEK